MAANLTSLILISRSVGSFHSLVCFPESCVVFGYQVDGVAAVVGDIGASIALLRHVVLVVHFGSRNNSVAFEISLMVVFGLCALLKKFKYK